MERLPRSRSIKRMPTRQSTGATIIPGYTLDNPVTGERFTFTDTAASTDGELLAFDLDLRPGGAVPIAHVHPIQSERFEVLEGEMRFRLGLRTALRLAWRHRARRSGCRLTHSPTRR